MLFSYLWSVTGSFEFVFTDVEVILTGGSFGKWSPLVLAGTYHFCACKLQAGLFTGLKLLTGLTGRGEVRQIQTDSCVTCYWDFSTDMLLALSLFPRFQIAVRF